MTVEELINKLRELPFDKEVFLFADRYDIHRIKDVEVDEDDGAIYIGGGEQIT